MLLIKILMARAIKIIPPKMHAIFLFFLPKNLPRYIPTKLNINVKTKIKLQEIIMFASNNARVIPTPSESKLEKNAKSKREISPVFSSVVSLEKASLNMFIPKIKRTPKTM